MYYRYVKIVTALIAVLILFSSHFARSENANQRSDLDLALDFYHKDNFVESRKFWCLWPIAAMGRLCTI
jgi:predicted nucleotidyltransferase